MWNGTRGTVGISRILRRTTFSMKSILFPRQYPIPFAHPPQTELDASLDALAEDAKCGAAWTTFSDTISTAEFNLMPLAGQVKVGTWKAENL